MQNNSPIHLRPSAIPYPAGFAPRSPVENAISR